MTLALLAPLILGLLLSQLVPLNLRGLQGVYLLLVVGATVVAYFLTGEWLPALIAAAAGFIVVLILAGIFGERIRAADYGFAQFGVGLFPWTYWDFTASLIYAILLVMFGVLVALRPKFKNPFVRFNKSGGS